MLPETSRQYSPIGPYLTDNKVQKTWNTSSCDEYHLTSNAITVTVTGSPRTTARRHRASGRLCRLSFFDCCSILQNEDATLLKNDPAVAAKPIPACQNHSAEILMQVVHFITENLHADLSVSALARTFSQPESVLFRAFKLQTGIALDRFVLRRRIERALHLLKHSKATDTEIAMGIGWGSAPDFQRAFASYLGVSPTDYRRSLRLKQQATSVKSHKRRCKCACVGLEESCARAV